MFTRRTLLLSGLSLPLLAPGAGADHPGDWREKLLTAARGQIGLTLSYDPAYSSIPYPQGDVPRSTGVCTDVIIRAYRDAFELDLQQLVHLDMAENFSRYPKNWGLSKPDRNIDHRRVPNLERWFERQGYERAIPGEETDWSIGDLVTMRLGGRLSHIAIFSGYTRIGKRPLYIHNIGAGTREEEILTDYTHLKRYRFPPETA